MVHVPLVGSIHRIVEKFSRKNFDIIIIGHHNHPEVVGTAGRTTKKVHIIETIEEARAIDLHKENECVFVTQTTLSQDEVAKIREVLYARFPQILSPKSTICYAKPRIDRMP